MTDTLPVSDTLHPCPLPPPGWVCTRPAPHDGEPCAAWPIALAPGAADPGELPLRWRLRLVYVMRLLQGRCRIVGPVDVSQLAERGYMQGTLRVYY